MATLSEMFEGKARDAVTGCAAYPSTMIRNVMNRADWAILLTLALIWGGAFFFISVAVAEVPLTAGAAVMLPLALLVDQPWLQPLPSAGAIGAIVALGLVCSALGYVLYFRLIDSAGATNALLITLLVPPVAILLGALFLSETIAARDLAGLALIAIGLAAIDGRLFAKLSRPVPA